MTEATRLIAWLQRALGVTQLQLVVLTAILLLGAVLRIVWVAYAARSPQEFHDPLFYMFYGGQIASGNGYRIPDGSPTSYYPIGYPATLGTLFFVIKHTFIPDNYPNAVGFLQVFLGTATAALAFYAGRRMFNAAVGLLAALWIALFPNLIYHTAAPLSETLFNFLTMAALVVLVAPQWTNGQLNRKRLVAAGMILGAASLVRPIALLWLPLLFLVLLYAHAKWRSALIQAGIVTVATFAVIAPWSVRNAIVMDAPLLVSANLGDDLCIGHHPGATGHFELPDECFAGYEQYKRPEYETRRNNDGIRSSISFASHHSLFEVKLIALKARWTYDHDHDGLWAVESYGDDPFINATLRPWLSHTADIFFFTTLSIGGLGLIGLAVTRDDPRRVFLVLGTLSFAAIPLVFFGDARFHVPAMPFLAIAGAWAVVTFTDAVRERPSGVDVSEGKAAVAQHDAL